jgi:chemotaxis protein methyltransferase CheR
MQASKVKMDLERLTPKQFELFQAFIYSRSGIKIESTKVTLVSNRIRRRLKAGGFTDFDAYYRFLNSPAGVPELTPFLDAITTNETFFFRTQSHFDWLRNEYVPGLLKAKSEGSRGAGLRVWSAACSSGEEPYSIAMCLAEASVLLRGWSIQILGTDISDSALKMAREAVFKKRALQEMDAARIQRHFIEEPDATWRLRSNIAEMVRFKHHNLLRPMHEPPFDCIWIRNVLIYFDRESKARVVEQLVKSLVPGGYLVVGPSEGLYDMLGMLQKRSAFLYQKPPKEAHLPPKEAS